MQHQKKRKRNAIYIKVLINISNNFTRYILFIIFYKIFRNSIIQLGIR